MQNIAFSHLTVELMVDDMSQSLDFYCKKLRFTIEVQVPEQGTPFFVNIKKDTVELMLYARQQFSEEIPSFASQKQGGTIALYISVDKIKELFQHLKQTCPVIQPLHKTNYGTTEFSITDPNGYVLMFTDKN